MNVMSDPRRERATRVKPDPIAPDAFRDLIKRDIMRLGPLLKDSKLEPGAN